MRVWLSPSAFFPHRGGVEELTFQLARELDATGHEVLIVTHRHPIELAGSETIEGIETRRIDFVAPRRSPPGLARFLLGARARGHSLDALGPAPDVINIQCVSVQAPYLIRFAKRHGVPLVVTTQGEVAMDAARIFERSFYMRSVLRASARAASALSACSTSAAEQAARVAPAFAGARVIPNGVDPAQWRVGALPRGPVVCAWGRQVPQKGFDLAIAAFALVRKQLPEARLLIGGDGPEAGHLRELAGDGVELLGALDRNRVRRLLKRSRVALLPSRVEPFGIVALETLAAGRGLVYAAGTGVVEAVGGLGRAADVNDPQAFAAAILAELAEPTDPESAAARVAELSWRRIAALYVNMYASAIGQVEAGW